MKFSRWQRLMGDFGCGANQDTYQSICAAYNEPHRHYHNASHIEAVLSAFDAVNHATASEAFENPLCVEMALWFHDVIYKPFSSSNEADSAAWAVAFLRDNGVSQSRIDAVESLIMATLHSHPATRPDERVIVDIDLGILGAEPEAYQRFERNVRKEYRAVPGFLYRKKRRQLLASFLERPRIFSHDYFYQRLESQARLNLTDAIEQL